jgi:hypothetical protein
MTTETQMNARGWATTLQRHHREMAGHVIAGQLTQNADDSVALSNWLLIEEEFLLLTARSRPVDMLRPLLPA